LTSREAETHRVKGAGRVEHPDPVCYSMPGGAMDDAAISPWGAQRS
jgi:hypothetical protein